MNSQKPQHTPGLWAIDKAPNGETTGIISANDGLTHVCDTFDAAFHNAIARGQIHPATEFLAQAQANAKLIAAAPSLLGELRDLSGFVEKFGDTMDRNAFMRAAEGYLTAAHAAIAKATD